MDEEGGEEGIMWFRFAVSFFFFPFFLFSFFPFFLLVLFIALS